MTTTLPATTTATTNPNPKRIAVIGGGAAGLAAARAVSRLENPFIVPQVLEKDSASGGVWRHVVENDHSKTKTRPMYRGLRTNLPKEIMAYREMQWDRSVKESYVTHRDVVHYLNQYRNEFQLDQYITFGAEVKQLTILTSSEEENDKTLSSHFSPKDETWPKIQLTWDEKHPDSTSSSSSSRGSGSSSSHSGVFDAVFVCNGHYATPSIPRVPGIDEYFKGKIIHSVEYDDPSDFAGETVLCIGGRASGADLAREVSQHARYVYLSDTVCPEIMDGQPHILGNVQWVPKTLEVLEDGSIRLDKNCAVTPQVDTIIFCTGYDYSFPFINTKSNLNLDCVPGERRVKPLYEQLWHAQYPNLAFVGIPHSVVPFPFFELQIEASLALWNTNIPRGDESGENDNINRVRSTGFPPLADRLKAAAQDAASGGAKKNGRLQDSHFLGDAQWDYCRNMAKLASNYDAAMEDYIATNKAIYDDSGASRKHLFPGGPDSYRSTCYERDPTNQGFLPKKLDEDALTC